MRHLLAVHSLIAPAVAWLACSRVPLPMGLPALAVLHVRVLSQVRTEVAVPRPDLWHELASLSDLRTPQGLFGQIGIYEDRSRVL